MGSRVVRFEFEHAHKFRLRQRGLLLENVQVAERDVNPRIPRRGLGRGLVALLGLRQFRFLHRGVAVAQVVVDRFAVASGDQPYA